MELSAGRMPSRVPTIVVADDDWEIRNLLSQILIPAGYDVLLAADGGEACDLFARCPQTCAVITDLVMPNQEGIDTIRAIRRRSAVVHIIAMSGAWAGQFLPIAKRLGADATLTKPFTIEALLAALAPVSARYDARP